MRGFTKRIIALTLAGAGATTAMVIGAGAACAATDASGTVTLTLSDSFVTQLALHGVIIVPEGTAAESASGGNVVLTFSVTGGDGSLDNYAGSLLTSGSFVGFSFNGGFINLTALNYNVFNESWDASINGGSDTPVLDLNGNWDATVADPDQSMAATQLTVDPAGAAALDSVLNTDAFVANANVGSFSASWVLGS